MKQKIVIKVAMTCDKCRSKAMSLVAKTSGVESVAITGDGKDQVVVVGDVDSIKLTRALRKKVGPAQLLEVADADKKKKEEEKKKKAAEAAMAHYPWPYPYHYPPMVYEERPEYACTIL